MNKMIMKTFLLVISLLALSYLLWGCNALQPQALEETEQTDTALDAVTVRIAVFAGSEQPNLEKVEAAADALLAPFGIRLEILFVEYSAWEQSLNLMLTGGGPTVDLFVISSKPVSDYVEHGRVMALDDLLDEYGRDIVEIAGMDVLEACRVGGHIYAVPAQKDHAASYGLMMRKDIVDALDIHVESIRTLDDLDQVFALVKKNYPQLCPLVPNSSEAVVQCWGWDDLGDNHALGVVLNMGQDSTVENLYESTVYEQFVRTMRRWYEKGYVLADILSSPLPGTALVKQGKAFSYFHNLKPGVDLEQTRQTGYEMVAVTLVPAYVTTSDISKFSWAVAEGCAHPQQAMIVLNQLYSDPELAQLLCNGIENENYVYTDESHTVIDYPEGIDFSNNTYETSRYVWPNSFITPVWSPQPPDFYERIRQFNETAVKSRALNFIPYTLSVADQVEACGQVVEKYNFMLMSGAVEVDKNLEAFRRELAEAGIEDIIRVKQSQYELWLREN